MDANQSVAEKLRIIIRSSNWRVDHPGGNAISNLEAIGNHCDGRKTMKRERDLTSCSWDKRTDSRNSKASQTSGIKYHVTRA